MYSSSQCSPDGQYVAAGSSDGTLFVWETFTGKVKSKKEHRWVPRAMVCVLTGTRGRNSSHAAQNI